MLKPDSKDARFSQDLFASILIGLAAILVAFVAPAVSAQRAKPAPLIPGTEIRQTKPNGQVDHSKPYFRVRQNGVIVQYSPTGIRQAHKQKYKIEQGKLYPLKPNGQIDRSKRNVRIFNDR